MSMLQRRVLFQYFTKILTSDFQFAPLGVILILHLISEVLVTNLLDLCLRPLSLTGDKHTDRSIDPCAS